MCLSVQISNERTCFLPLGQSVQLYRPLPVVPGGQSKHCPEELYCPGSHTTQNALPAETDLQGLSLILPPPLLQPEGQGKHCVTLVAPGSGL